MVQLVSLSPTRTQTILYYTMYPIVQKLSNKQSAKMICRFDRLRTAHSKSHKVIWVIKCFIPHMHLIIYCSGSTLAWPVVKTLLWWWIIVWTIISACNTSYVLPYRCMSGIINLCFYHSHAWIYMLYLYKVCIKSKQTSI